MSLRRMLWIWLVGVTAACGAAAQAPGGIRWQATTESPLGLQARSLGTNLIARAGVVEDIGVYGRFGTVTGRRAALVPGTAPDGIGLTYGIGVSWEFSERGSAVLGWDSYDFGSLAGERNVRATSLGLQWRY